MNVESLRRYSRKLGELTHEIAPSPAVAAEFAALDEALSPFNAYDLQWFTRVLVQFKEHIDTNKVFLPPPLPPSATNGKPKKKAVAPAEDPQAKEQRERRELEDKKRATYDKAATPTREVVRCLLALFERFNHTLVRQEEIDGIMSQVNKLPAGELKLVPILIDMKATGLKTKPDFVKAVETRLNGAWRSSYSGKHQPA